MELPYLRPLKIYMERMKQAPSCERVRSISCSVEQWLFFMVFKFTTVDFFFYQDTPLLLKLSQFSIFTSIHTTFHFRDFSPKITLTLACTGIRILRTCRS